MPCCRVSLANQRSDARPESGGCTATSLEVSRPSDDITIRVRLTRVYLPRHLPPLTFSRPSTVFSSFGLLALFHASVVHGVQRAAVTLTRQPRARRGRFPGRRVLRALADRSRRDGRRPVLLCCQVVLLVTLTDHSSPPSVDDFEKRTSEPTRTALPEGEQHTDDVSATRAQRLRVQRFGRSQPRRDHRGVLTE